MTFKDLSTIAHLPESILSRSELPSNPSTEVGYGLNAPATLVLAFDGAKFSKSFGEVHHLYVFDVLGKVHSGWSLESYHIDEIHRIYGVIDNRRNIDCKLLDQRLGTAGWELDYATIESAGIDIRACISEPITLKAGDTAIIPAGIALDINDPSLAAILIPRSGIGSNRGIILGNSVGLLDSDYHGEVGVAVWNRNQFRSDIPDLNSFTIEPGMRIAQLVFVPVVQARLNIVKEFRRTTERGLGGFGSSGV
jgi:dUTP pyrophosphatase